MPKKISGKKLNKGAVENSSHASTAKSPSVGKTPMSKKLSFLLKKADTLKEEAQKIAQKSSTVYQAVDTVHQAADDVHHKIQDTHRRARGATRPIAEQTDSVKSKPFLIVGIGASAGGFEAFISMLENLRPDTGMAFVYVQHLDPTHESKLTELFQRATKMQVLQIENQMPVLPDRVYVIPPNSGLTIAAGLLQLSPRKRPDQYLPVDRFFQSLAQEQGNRAIGIVLSGTGHDGTVGLREVKAEGGITFAQDEKTAKYQGMPASAVDSGCVDFIMPPESIARELDRIARHFNVSGDRKTKAEPTLPGTESELTKIFVLLRGMTGVDFSYYKPTTLKRRIARRMVLKKIDTLKNYLVFLQQNPAEVENLFQDILVNVTGFFRDVTAFNALKKKIFPKILKQKPAGAPIRIWVPGCATGEEVYSLAICLHEYLGRNMNNKSIQIFGTDVSENMVSKARMGIYPQHIASEVTGERLRRYFQKIDNGYQISKFIRDLCVFAKQNLIEDPPFSKLDLISCRNLLIYFGPQLQRKVMPIFHYSLRPGGYLVLGTSETIGSFSSLFTLVDKKNKIFVRNETYTRPEIEIQPTAMIELSEPRPVKQKEEVSHFDLQKRASEILLSQFTPPALIVNARMDVLHFRGKTGPYLEPATGSASLNVLKIVRGELTMDLRTALTRAIKMNVPVRKEAIRIKFNGHYKDVTIEVVPFKNPPVSERFFLILFHDITVGSGEEPKGKKKSANALQQQRAEQEVSRLREEISQTKESLQTIIEEQEATNEELKSANEEIQSSNEELQSTNEELETAKEELQSTNEELTTLNEELQNRNNELSQANNDLNNLISSFNMPILMLGNDLTIRRFTPLAQRIFNLIPSDVGRRISDINANIPMADLDQLVSEVIDSLHIKEMEVKDRDGRWYSLRIRPYRTSENKIEGAVVVLVDIGDVRQSLEEMSELVPYPILVLSGDLQVNKANEAFYKTFQVAKEETEGRPIFDLGNGQWNIPPLRTLLETILPTNNKVENFRVEHEFPKIGRKVFNFNARRLYQPSQETRSILVYLEEVK